MQSFRGCSRCESRGISKNVHVEGGILVQKPRRPTETALVWRSVSNWEIGSKRNPCSRALVIWNRFQLSLPLWGSSVSVPELALRGVSFCGSDHRLRGALRQRRGEDARRCIFRSGTVCAGLSPAFFWSLGLGAFRSLSCACCYARAVVRVLLVESRPGGLRFWNLRDERSTFFCW